MLFAGCAGVSPESLLPASTKSSLVVRTDVFFEDYLRLNATTVTHTLKAGTYTAKYEDASRIYYEGEGKCLILQNILDTNKEKGLPQPKPWIMRCGIVQSKAAPNDLQVYHYLNPEDFESTSGSLAGFDKSATPVQSVGTGLASALVSALAAEEMKYLRIGRIQPKPGVLQSVIERR
jgi:hypothetical protein